MGYSTQNHETHTHTHTSTRKDKSFERLMLLLPNATNHLRIKNSLQITMKLERKPPKYVGNALPLKLKTDGFHFSVRDIRLN